MRTALRALGASALMVIVSACSGASAPIVDPRVLNSISGDRLASGSWGGQHIAMMVSDTGAAIEYDCASGTISGPLTVGADGRFDWRGTHYIGHGGPSYPGEIPDAHPARYTGSIKGDQMSLVVSLLDIQTFAPATFTLTFGATPMVFRCL